MGANNTPGDAKVQWKVMNIRWNVIRTLLRYSCEQPRRGSVKAVVERLRFAALSHDLGSGPAMDWGSGQPCAPLVFIGFDHFFQSVPFCGQGSPPLRSNWVVRSQNAPR